MPRFITAEEYSRLRLKGDWKAEDEKQLKKHEPKPPVVPQVDTKQADAINALAEAIKGMAESQQGILFEIVARLQQEQEGTLAMLNVIMNKPQIADNNRKIKFNIKRNKDGLISEVTTGETD